MHDTPEQAWIDAALEQALIGWSEGGIPIGAVLVDDAGEVVARGRNRRVQTGDPTAHAEIDCLRRAGRRRDWPDLTLVSTLSPCVMCSGAAALLRIGRVIVGENRTFQGAEDLLRQHGAVVEVVDDQRCVAIMQRLQRQKPDLWHEDIGR